MSLSVLMASRFSRLNKTKAASATNTRGFFVQLQRKEQVAYEYFTERGRSSLACGESEKNAQAQVNLGRSKKPAPNQQQESTEVISSASC